MIKVTYHRDFNRVTVEGHALSGEAGHDLACASASILAYTLAEFVKNMNEAGQIAFPAINLNKGYALIACNTPGQFKNSVTLAFDTVCAGFEILAQSYPDNISYEIK